MGTAQMGPTCKEFVAEEQRQDFLEVLDVIQELERANGSWAETTPWQTDQAEDKVRSMAVTETVKLKLYLSLSVMAVI